MFEPGYGAEHFALFLVVLFLPYILIALAVLVGLGLLFVFIVVLIARRSASKTKIQTDDTDNNHREPESPETIRQTLERLNEAKHRVKI